MTKSILTFLLPFLLSSFHPSLLFAQTTIHRDPTILQLVAQVSADSLKAYVEKLVSFGTRQTLSGQQGQRGIAPAREWILNKFQEFGKQAGGRLTATIDTWTLPPDGRRIDKAVDMGNVMATLKGTDAADDRSFLVSGHMDSRVSDVRYRNDRYLRGGDHTPFVNRGFAAVRITEMNENFQHQHQDLRVENGVDYGDKVEYMDFEYLRKNTAMNLANLANLAKSPSPPQKVMMDIRSLANTTKPYWQAPKTGKVKGYYILMRQTHWPFWQKKFFTDKLGAEMPYSKDNYFFAVQAVSEDGNESFPVLPKPGMY